MAKQDTKPGVFDPPQANSQGQQVKLHQGGAIPILFACLFRGFLSFLKAFLGDSYPFLRPFLRDLYPFLRPFLKGFLSF